MLDSSSLLIKVGHLAYIRYCKCLQRRFSNTRFYSDGPVSHRYRCIVHAIVRCAVRERMPYCPSSVGLVLGVGLELSKLLVLFISNWMQIQIWIQNDVRMMTGYPYCSLTDTVTVLIRHALILARCQLKLIKSDSCKAAALYFAALGDTVLYAVACICHAYVLCSWLTERQRIQRYEHVTIVTYGIHYIIVYMFASLNRSFDVH